MRPLEPTLTASLFRGLADELVGLLGSLEAADWERPTLAGAWRVRDVAAHLLDGDLRKLSFHRDGHAPPAPAVPISSERELTAYIDQLNASGVEAARRLSPRLLTRLLAVSGPEVAAFVESLDPQGQALFPVAWAGEEVSLHWMDTGREYTERWHHQQQIREATGRAGLLGREWLRPVLEISLRALPHAYRGVEAEVGRSLRDRRPLGGRVDPGARGRGLAARCCLRGGRPRGSPRVALGRHRLARLLQGALAGRGRGARQARGRRCAR
jgi:uncharacterized protein (TIGR03083 family)